MISNYVQMAEPLSIAASVAGLITLTELIASQGYVFVKRVKNAKAETTKLLAEVTGLFGFLKSLQLVLARLETHRSENVLQLDYLHDCQKLVFQLWSCLKLALHEEKDGCWTSVDKSLRWPFTATGNQSLIKDLKRYKTALSLTLNADGLYADVTMVHILKTNS